VTKNLKRIAAAANGGSERVTEPIFARDGAEAPALVFAEVPDLVLLDMRLPLIEGGAVLRRIKADPRTAHVSVVVLSGVADSETIRRTRLDGADGYLTKPFDVHELLDLTDRLLAGPVQVAGRSADADSDEVLDSRTVRPGGRGRSSR
jgi:CheY-like chemotaxis protein